MEEVSSNHLSWRNKEYKLKDKKIFPFLFSINKFFWIDVHCMKPIFVTSPKFWKKNNG